MADRPPDPGELQRLGLYDPEDEHAADRLALIRYLFELGATVEDLRRVQAGDLPGVAALLAIRGRPTLTMAEAAARAGISEELALRVYRAVGFPIPTPTRSSATRRMSMPCARCAAGWSCSVAKR
ncbi:MAG TPA: hypothetical protein VKH36_09150 [Acidimicrobiia bacterium]|nr:hypothetical protein [Acidimicrobiia bacterium]